MRNHTDHMHTSEQQEVKSLTILLILLNATMVASLLGAVEKDGYYVIFFLNDNCVLNYLNTALIEDYSSLNT